MKYLILTVLFLSLGFAAHAQTTTETTKQPKLRMASQFMTMKYEIGDKDSDRKSVLLHLEKTSAAAYHDFKMGIDRENAAVLALGISVGGLLVGTFAKDTNTKIYGYSAALSGAVVSLVYNFSSQSKYEKAINRYNKQFGY
jgi:hypothetical protein